MKSFKQYIIDTTSFIAKSDTKSSHSHDDDEDDARQVLFFRRKRRKPTDKLVDFGAKAFLHSYNTAAADAAQRRWKVDDGKRSGHLSKEPG